MLSFRYKITLALAGIAAFAVTASGAGATRETIRTLRRLKMEEERLLAKTIAIQLDGYMRRIRYAIERLASEPEIESMARERQRYPVGIVSRETELIDAIVVSDKSGRVLLKSRVGTERVLPSHPEKILAAPARRRRTLFSRPFRSPSGEIGVAIGAPIRRGDAIVGVLSGIVILNRHSIGGIEKIRFGKSGSVQLLDGKGRIIMSPPGGALFPADPARFSAYARARAAGWIVAVSQDVGEAFAPSRRLAGMLSMIFLAALAASIALGCLLAWPMTRPVSRLMEAVSAMAEGRIDARVEPRSRDEIGRLTMAFNAMAERLSRDMSELEEIGYCMAHDLRTPARNVESFSEILLARAERWDGESRGYLERVMESGRRMGLMLDGLVHLERIARRRPSLQQVDLTALARAYLDRLAAREPQRRVEAAVAEGIFAYGDPGMLRLLMRHLLDNAWKYTADRPDARVEVGWTLSDGGRPVYFVRDNGVGFDAAAQGRIFAPFHHPRGSGESAEGGGVGIGLAAAARIVRVHGGRIWSESRPGEGATFYFQLGHDAWH